MTYGIVYNIHMASIFIIKSADFSCRDISPVFCFTVSTIFNTSVLGSFV